MSKRTVKDLQLHRRKVIMRVDFNVPLKNGVIQDDTRIQAALPTIKYCLDKGAAVILMSHLGRPNGKVKPELSLKPCADHLATLVDAPVKMAPDCIGDAVEEMASSLHPGQILVLENTRFHSADDCKFDDEGMSDEEKALRKKELKVEQKEMAKQLARLADVFVNDAFGTAHRAHASTAVICDYIGESALGFLMEKEVECLGHALSDAVERPYAAIIGGAKISGKLEVLKSLIKRVDTLIIGGGMAYTFMKANGRQIGNSICEDDLVDTARDVMAKAKELGVNLLLPSDNVIADKFAADANTRVVSGDIPAAWEGVDIGPASVAAFTAAIAGAKTIIWNGPMGVFEMAPFAKGTMAVCQAVADADAYSIIGGGDSVSAVNQSGLADRMTHISTGGGASLEFLEGKTLPGIAAVQDKQ